MSVEMFKKIDGVLKNEFVRPVGYQDKLADGWVVNKDDLNKEEEKKAGFKGYKLTVVNPDAVGLAVEGPPKIAEEPLEASKEPTETSEPSESSKEPPEPPEPSESSKEPLEVSKEPPEELKTYEDPFGFDKMIDIQLQKAAKEIGFAEPKTASNEELLKFLVNHYYIS